MTSGNFASVLITDIWVNREGRQRRELEGISELAASIARTGLINPPVVRKSNGELIAGERRFEACKSLGWTSISCQWAEDLLDHELHLIELEENVRRVDLPWQDQCQAALQYHRLRLSIDPTWNQTRTAEALNITKGTLSNLLSVAEEITQGNSRVVGAPKFSTARNIISRDAERKRTSIITALEGQARDVPIECADFHQWAPAYEGSLFNFIHCDFPYGINAHKMQMGPAAVVEHTQGTYEDTPDDYFGLISSLEHAMPKVVAESAHLMFWFSMHHYAITLDLLTDMGWNVNPFPLIWFKSDNTGVVPDPRHDPRRIYETCFFATRGKRQIVQSIANCFPCPTPTSQHMSEKPIAMLGHFMRMIVDEHTSILDPTCGSGNALIAAKRLGATTLLGLERDADFAERARSNYRSAIFGNGEGNG
jgi:ParB family chromosome partitioning protein